MKIEHLTCDILCGDEALVEYQEKLDLHSEDTGRKAKSCYIVSEVGKRFIPRVTSNPHRFDVDVYLWIDGQCLYSLHLNESGSSEMPGAYVDGSRLRPFIFSSIMTTDDDHLLQEDPSAADELGTMSMEVFRVQTSSTDPEYVSTYEYNLDNLPVHERTKKAGTHRVICGEVETAETSTFVDTTWIDPADSPYYIFTWRYRPKALLQAQGIVPQDPSRSSKRPSSIMPSSTSSQAKRPRVDQLEQGSSSQVKLEDLGTTRESQRLHAPDQPDSQRSPSSRIPIENTRTVRELKVRQNALRAQRAALEAQEAALKAQKTVLDVQEADLEEELRQAIGAKRAASPVGLVSEASRENVIDLTVDD